MNKYQEALNNMCKNCQRLMSEIKTPIRDNELSNANCGHQLCPYRHIDNSYCEDYMVLQGLIDNYSIMEKALDKVCNDIKHHSFEFCGYCGIKDYGNDYEKCEKCIKKHYLESEEE